MVYAQDIFFIIASIFLGLATILLFVVFFYWIKILKDLAKLSSDFKEVGKTFKEKMEWISGVLAGIITFIEKITEVYLKKKEKVSKKSKKS
ncbi:MAG: hypothetical protein CO034_01355 [Parcubacteria group bacterium CG_4_9_14_0_2_um_filter_35_11]|nr:MAG: hypothetical protein COS98_00605 [Parcubacteria group bacterium CG07_land_8_20_14_0_80_35_11]PJC47786.1 MAG: hypothetical protein CO034_01355 [Parcubacteria group bacterium CG_4_9_14_0_2_um_filter_35_11]